MTMVKLIVFQSIIFVKSFLELPLHLTDLTFNRFNAFDHVFHTVIAYCQQNWYIRLAIYTDFK